MKIITLNQVAPWTDDFFFLKRKGEEYLVICNPSDSICLAPTYLRSHRSLEDHIQLIRERCIKKAIVVAEDIDFLRQCLELEELDVHPSFNASDFDFSPLYDMPNLRKLACDTVYGPNEDRVSCIDYSKFKSLEALIVGGRTGHNNVSAIKSLRYLAFEGVGSALKTLVGAFSGEFLSKLIINGASIGSLEGIQQAPKLSSLSLFYNRRLSDISDLTCLKETLTELDIEGCGKIKDFSALGQLKRLEHLRLVGSNVLPDLSFLQNMPQLQSLVLYMNVADGDLSCCLSIPYVNIKNRRHYNFRNEDFAKRNHH